MHLDSVRAMIADHLGVDPETASDGAYFRADLGADSLDMIELAMRLEQDLDITIADDESESCDTVGDALNLIEAKLARRQAA